MDVDVADVPGFPELMFHIAKELSASGKESEWHTLCVSIMATPDGKARFTVPIFEMGETDALWLTDEDREALRQSASDLSDIPPNEIARIKRDFADAYKRAREIAEGLRSPL